MMLSLGFEGGVRGRPQVAENNIPGPCAETEHGQYEDKNMPVGGVRNRKQE